MVALRGGNNSLTTNHGCGSHGGQQIRLDATRSLQAALGMLPSNGHQQNLNHHQTHSSHGNQPNVQTLNNISVQFIPQQNSAALKPEQNHRFSNSNSGQSSHHFRPQSSITPSRQECYHPSGSTSGNYITNAAAASNPPQTLRGQPTPQPSAPPAPQQDMSKTTMAGPSYVTQQNQSQQARPQYSNFQYRNPQHATRPSSHPRQQQPYMSGAGASASGPVMYHHPIMYPMSQPMSIPQSYQQPRSSTPGYYHFVPPQYIAYTTTGNPAQSYYYGNGSNQQLPAGTVGTNPGRSNPGGLVPQQVTAPATPATPLPHPQPQPHLHPPMSGLRQGNHTKRTLHRMAIINPITNKDILKELDNQNGAEQSERPTPQPDKISVAEEFTRKVNEMVNQPSSSESANKSNNSKTVVVPNAMVSPTQSHFNALNSIGNSIIKSEVVNINEIKNQGPDTTESIETPVVSAISDSPVVVPKMSINVNKIQKSSDNQSIGLENSKNLSIDKKQNKNIPFVPQDEIEKESESDTVIVSQLLCPPSLQPGTASTLLNTGATYVTSRMPVTLPAPMPISEVSSTITSPTSATAISFDHKLAAMSKSAINPHLPMVRPQPQRVKERFRTENREKSRKEIGLKLNGPSSVEISSVDSVTDTINPSTSQLIQLIDTSSFLKQIENKKGIESEKSNLDKSEVVINTTFPSKLTATELLSASIEKLAKEQPLESEIDDTVQECSAQAKLTNSIASVTRINLESKMKDINLNNKPTESDTANGNIETAEEDLNKNEKLARNSKNNNKKSNKVANHDLLETNQLKVESLENGKDENLRKPEEEPASVEGESSDNVEMPVTPAPAVFIPKYKYSDDQWSPLNKSGRKHYDIDLLMQIKDDPLCKNKPNAPLLETCNVFRTTPIQEPMIFNPITRPVMNDGFYPNFLKNSGTPLRNNIPKEIKKDGRNMPLSGKGTTKLSPSVGGSSHKPIIHVSLSLREDVKLNQSKDAWKPARFKKDGLTEEEAKTQELYKNFRGILNKLTPQKFDTLLERVKSLEINTKTRLEGVIELIFEKAIDEPNFSEAYAAMCNKLSVIKVPTNNNSPDQCVNFRNLIINRCQNQFENVKVDEQVERLEKEVAECTDPVKKKELLLQLEEENRRVRMRSVGNVRFIGELYKLKMLTSKIMVFCMNNLIEKLEEEKLECLCKLLTTIGEQVESEAKESLELVFKKMQDIVDRKSDKITSRVRFMIQDVIELKRRKWVTKNVVDSQPKMMDQIQKEAEQQQRHIELMNSPMGGGYRRDDAGRGKRNDGRRQGSNTFMDNSYKATRNTYTVDTNKLKAGTQKSNFNNLKLAPQTTWNHGSGTKNMAQTTSSSMISLSKNKYSVLENVQTDPTSIQSTKDLASNYHHSKSIERSTFNSKGDFNNGSGSKAMLSGITRSNSGSRSLAVAPTPAAEAANTTVAQETLPEDKAKMVKMMIKDHLDNPNHKTVVTDIQQLYPPQYHSNVVTEILNVALDKSAKEVQLIVKLLTDLVVTNTISAENFILGLTEILNFAPDLYIDIPMLYEYLGQLIVPQIEKKVITLGQALKACDKIIAADHGHLILKSILKNLKDSMGPFFVKSKWTESGLKLNQWMNAEMVPKWIEDNKFEFLESGKFSEETKKIITPMETQSKLTQLMICEETCETIQGWIQDNLGISSNEDWFLRALSQAICEYALYGSDNRDVPRFSLERMNKYSQLIISALSESRVERETSCLFGIQQLIHRLEHPQGLTLEIFQYLHEQYIISVEGFIAWEGSEKEPEGKAVMLKALTSFFTNIREADNEDSCGED